jgi:hypothetical protein
MDNMASPVQNFVRKKLAPTVQGGASFSPLKQQMAENNSYVQNLGTKSAEIFIQQIRRFRRLQGV